MKKHPHSARPRSNRALPACIAAVTLLAGPASALAAGYTVQQISSPGPAMDMSNNGKVTGYYVAKCTTLSSQPKRTICYNAPWLFDGKTMSKLSGAWPSNANAKAVAVNDSGHLIGADLTGAWFYANGRVAYVDGADTSVSRGSRLVALNNPGMAVGMSYVASVYQPVTYTYGGTATAAYGTGYSVVDVNDAGMVVGWFKNAAGIEQGFVADAGGSISAIANLGSAINCRPVRVSQVGTGTASVWVAGNCAGNRPFRYEVTSGTLQELSFAGSSSLSVVSINSRGEAAGTAVRPGAAAPDGYTAILWSTDVANPADLNGGQAFAPASAWNVHATDINEAGTVLAGYNDTKGNFYTFLLRPVP
jgi:hypothetical protein